MSEDVLVKWGWLIADLEVAPGCGCLRDCIVDLAAEVRALRENEVCADTECCDLHIRELQARVAELETDATLGRMVRELPRNAKLGHEGQQWSEWYAVWPGTNYKYNRQYGSTPEEALEAAQKEER